MRIYFIIHWQYVHKWYLYKVSQMRNCNFSYTYNTCQDWLYYPLVTFSIVLKLNFLLHCFDMKVVDIRNWKVFMTYSHVEVLHISLIWITEETAFIAINIYSPTRKLWVECKTWHEYWGRRWRYFTISWEIYLGNILQLKPTICFCN